METLLMSFDLMLKWFSVAAENFSRSFCLMDFHAKVACRAHIGFVKNDSMESDEKICKAI
ncbi:CLUMA_CG010157, isoform A [Clunio marinus]|uniref:CLUMA_CG010157, isoform A n=1 Tax=Clunio marinus TaxID=568069 RepID=A0A1J1I8S6_9DIPT|nr:CLUMA_CG010157, isoform A [Clunio marinus]